MKAFALDKDRPLKETCNQLVPKQHQFPGTEDMRIYSNIPWPVIPRHDPLQHSRAFGLTCLRESLYPFSAMSSILPKRGNLGQDGVDGATNGQRCRIVQSPQARYVEPLGSHGKGTTRPVICRQNKARFE